MPRFKYVGPTDAVDVPALGAVGVKKGDTVSASGREAELLAAQPDAWEQIPGPKKEQ